MPQRTNPFQNLAASIMAVLNNSDYLVEESVLEVNPKTGVPREIDILITEVVNKNNKIMVECRDWKRKQDVIWIDQLEGKARSLNIKRVIAVSSSGFYDTTLKEAESRGIETMHLREAEVADVTKWKFSIKEFGLNIDFEPVVTKVQLVSPEGFTVPDLSIVNSADLFLLNLNEDKKIPLTDYLKGLVKDSKITDYVRANNSDNAINHYDYTVPCDKGVGYCVDGKVFIPLVSLIVSIDSRREAKKVAMKHLRAGNHKILVGDVDDNARVVLEEKEGQLLVMFESRTEKAPKE